jgi:hypothetical protein
MEYLDKSKLLDKVQYWTYTEVVEEDPMSSTQTPVRKVDPKTASKPALKAFFRIADRWKLDVEQQLTLLGAPARSTFFKWKKDQDGHLTMDALERISYLLGIFKALHILLPDEDAADAWVKKPNTAPLFAGTSALDRMMSGHVSDLYVIRQYLDAQRGGWS